MGRFTGFLGLVVILAAAWLFSRKKKSIKPQHRRLGPGAAIRLCPVGAENRFRQDIPGHRRGREQHAGLRAGRHRVHVRPLGVPGRAVRRHLRVPGSAHHHLHRLVLLHPVLPGRHAVGGERHGHRDAKGHGHQRRGVAQRGGQHLHGPDRSAAHHQAVPRRTDGIRTLHHHDQRDGARLRFGDGGLCHWWRTCPSRTC